MAKKQVTTCGNVKVKVPSPSSPGCGLGEHVRTTSPYTFIVAALSIILGNIPVGMGLYGPWVALLLGTGVMAALVYGLGKEPTSSTSSKKVA